MQEYLLVLAIFENAIKWILEVLLQTLRWLEIVVLDNPMSIVNQSPIEHDLIEVGLVKLLLGGKLEHNSYSLEVVVFHQLVRGTLVIRIDKVVHLKINQCFEVIDVLEVRTDIHHIDGVDGVNCLLQKGILP